MQLRIDYRRTRGGVEEVCRMESSSRQHPTSIRVKRRDRTHDTFYSVYAPIGTSQDSISAALMDRIQRQDRLVAFRREMSAARA